MHTDKSLGPDGMSPAFFQKHWDIVGHDIVELVKQFFENGTIEGNLNDTNIVLIPKKKNPSRVGDLKPISLCNILIKIITKVLANRIKELLDKVVKELLDKVVSNTQSAFILGRLISDNVMISYEVMHYLKRKRRGRDGFMALKVDMSKVYDRIERKYLKAILKKMGFSDWWVFLVLQCVTTVSYNIIHGENTIGPIQPARGIRQVDPLSPYLFIICAEGFSSLIRKFEADGSIHGIRVCRQAPVVYHMLFADDSYLFCKATEEEAVKVQQLLQIFERASGQRVNVEKSSIFFSMNVLAEHKRELCQSLQMAEANECSTYLGLPNILDRNKSVILGYLKEKINKRVRSWDGKVISKSGKEILIKSVAQALPTFAMSVFLLPVQVIHDIERILAKYWWSSSKEGSISIHWMSWDRLCNHKTAGGLGFKNLREFILAMLGKQGWRFLTRPESLATQMYKARYFGDGNFLDARLGHNPNFVWRSI